MAHHNERFTSFIKKELAIFLDREVSRSKVVFFSVTHVVVTQSGDSAKIFISFYPEKYAAETMKILKGYEKAARAHLAKIMKRKRIPFLIFVLDKWQEQQLRLEKLLKNSEDK